MTYLYKHPLLAQCYDVMRAIEECGASEKLTHATTLAGNLMRAIDAHVDADQAELAECAPYLKEGETPAQRIQREIGDCHAVTGLLAAARAECEKLQRVLAATEAQSNQRFQQVMTMMERHAEAVRERNSLQQHCDRLTGMKFSDRMHAALVARAEEAEADLARARDSDEHNFERWRRAVAELNALKAQLPEGMKDCTIVFKSCCKGHGFLTATNWVQRDCPYCEIDALQEDLGRERMRLAACSAVALADTPDSAKEARQMHPDYRSAACDDVARRVDECIALRHQRDELRMSLRAEANYVDLMYRNAVGAKKGG